MFSTRETAKLVRMSEQRVRGLARAGVVGVTPATAITDAEAEAQVRFDFRDLSVLRAAGKLLEQGLPAARVESALRALRSQVKQPLSSLTLAVENGQVVASDGTRVWNPATGQQRFCFDREPAPIVAAQPNRGTPLSQTLANIFEGPNEMASADYWFDVAMTLEESDSAGAYDAYLRALACNPEHVEANINIGRMCSSGGDLPRAAAYFRQAIRIDPSHPVSHFNLAVTLHDLGDIDGAESAYRAALIHDNAFADAHFNLAALLEQRGDSEQALLHLRAYHQAKRGTDE